MRPTNFIEHFFLSEATAKNMWKAMTILVAGLVLTFAAASYIKHLEEANTKKELVLVCNEIKTKILVQLHAHAQLLRSGSAFFMASDTITRQGWQSYIADSKIYKNLPGIQGVGYSVIIPKNELQQHIVRIRNEGFPDYTVKPVDDRPDYTSIIYIEPFNDRNLRAFGYDMFSEPVRRRAMEVSRDSDVAMLSGKVILVQESDKDIQYGTLMYVPVYRKGMTTNTVEQRRSEIIGWVYSPFRMNDLMQGILGRWDSGKLDRIHLQVYEDSLSFRSLLYNSQISDTLKHNDLSSRTVSLDIEFNGKKWILYFTQSIEQSAAISSKVITVFLSGIAISLLLMALSLSLISTRFKAQQIAGQLTLELKESEERFKILLNSTAEAIYGLDLFGNCTFSNTACIQILGYKSHDQLLGKNMHDLIHHSHADGSHFDVHNCRIFTAFINEKGTHVDDEVLWRPDGTFFPAEYWSVPVFINGKIEGAVVTFFDITERKQSLEKIKEARFEAEKANLAKSEFLSRMSHELRTPLNSILGFSQLLEMGELNTGQKKGVNHIMRSGKHLLNLINEVLDISRIESGQISLSFEPVQLEGIILEMIDTVQPLISGKHLSLKMISSHNDRLFVKSDRQRLKQVLLNLLNNAIKYNNEGGFVSVKTEMMHVTDAYPEGSLRILITDSGDGISAEDIPKLFKPFERIGAEKTATEGTGLGLAVVKKLMDSMGGSIGIESIQGEGSTFWIELPQCGNQLNTIEYTEGMLMTEPEIAELTGTILYIEDNSSNIELVEQILANHRKGIRLITNTKGGQAVNLAIEYAPDLIFLDLNLPDMLGSEVIKLLMAENKTKAIPVIIISADAMPQQIEKLLNAGSKNYLTKPLDLKTFLEVIDQWIG